MRAVSKEVRLKIVNAYNRGVESAVKIAEIFGITVRSVFRYVEQYNKTGNLNPLPRSGRPPILTEENLKIIKNIVLKNNDGTLQEYINEFAKITGIEISDSAMSVACIKLNLNRKKKSFYANEQERKDVQEKREDYINSSEKISADDMIFIDESGANLGMTSDYARAEGGERAISSKPFNIGKKFSIIGAISNIEIVAMMHIEGSINGEIFKTFIEKLLAPKLKSNHYVILDNVSFHKQHEVLKLIERTGAKVVFLPPYSPDLSPIEQMWSKVKNFLKRAKSRTEDDFNKYLSDALNKININDLMEWYENCGYEI